MFIYRIITQIAPPVPEWVIEQFNQTPLAQVTFWYHIGIWAIIFIAGYILTGYQKRFATALILSYGAYWALNRPYHAGLLSLDFKTNPLFKDGVLAFLFTDGHFGLLIQLAIGIVLTAMLIRALWYLFIVGPVRHKWRQHEGSAYAKKAQKQRQKQRPVATKGAKKSSPLPEQAHQDDATNEKDATKKDDVDFYL